jgi:O-antigen/teichoic acid export membrane protein
MVAMSLLRLASQIALSYLVLPEHFGTVALMRTFLTLVEMLSDMGIRGAVLYHAKGEERAFLRTAFSVQILRGVGMWLLTCALAWPAAAFYGEPLLLLLLPVAGLESVNNGFLCVRSYVDERRLKVAVPVLLELLALLVSVVTSVAWALLDPSAWALAVGPLAGGFVRSVVSHLWYRADTALPGWNREHARALLRYGRYVVGGTMVTFVAQQFHVLYLGKLLPLAVLGVYQVAWNFSAQAAKPITALANRVIIPHYAEHHRRSASEHEAVVRRSLARFLPACLLFCVGAGLFAPSLFGLFYDDSFASGGTMGELFAVVVWFMVLQHVPRSALLSVGASRAVAGMALANALFTVAGIVGGYLLGGGSIAGAIVGNALGNVAGCIAGSRSLRRHGLDLARPMAGYSLLFLALLGAGVLCAAGVERGTGLERAYASLVATVLFSAPRALWVWRGTRARAPLAPVAEVR